MRKKVMRKHFPKNKMAQYQMTPLGNLRDFVLKEIYFNRTGTGWSSTDHPFIDYLQQLTKFMTKVKFMLSSSVQCRRRLWRYSRLEARRSVPTKICTSKEEAHSVET